MTIDINGERGEFFQSYRGLRQGDPLSPLLFNLVGDALSAMLHLAGARGEIKGLVPHLIEGGANSQYADDTVIFMEYNEVNFSNTKFILFCFEAMSGMKINYNKSEIFGFGIDTELQEEVARIFGCRVGKLSMIYLGLPVNDIKISKAQFSYVSDKANKRLATWKCDTLPSGGKATLINSCLSSIPMYTMGVYQLYEGNFQALDKVRSRFFWQGTNKKRKYHMVKWEALAIPKEWGGLGFLEVKTMNICLLAKWLERLEVEEGSLCVELLRKKYLGNRSIFQITRTSRSQFWRGLLAIKHWFQRGRIVKIRSGAHSSFWHDTWLGNCPLKLEFDQLYKFCRDPHASVEQVMGSGHIQVEFRRSLNQQEFREWERLVELLTFVSLGEGRDIMC